MGNIENNDLYVVIASPVELPRLPATLPAISLG